MSENFSPLQFLISPWNQVQIQRFLILWIRFEVALSKSTIFPNFSPQFVVQFDQIPKDISKIPYFPVDSTLIYHYTLQIAFNFQGGKFRLYFWHETVWNRRPRGLVSSMVRFMQVTNQVIHKKYTSGQGSSMHMSWGYTRVLQYKNPSPSTKWSKFF